LTKDKIQVRCKPSTNRDAIIRRQAYSVGTVVLSQKDTNEDPFPNNRHFGGSNALFADGHVKWLLKEKFMYAPAGGAYWNNWANKEPDWLWNLE